MDETLMSAAQCLDCVSMAPASTPWALTGASARGATSLIQVEHVVKTLMSAARPQLRANTSATIPLVPSSADVPQVTNSTVMDERVAMWTSVP